MGRQGFRKFLKNHKRDRGMDFDHDVHDWLDGYPYEAALITEVEKEMQAVEFKAERVFGEPIPHPGTWSSANDEYVGRLFALGPPPGLLPAGSGLKGARARLPRFCGDQEGPGFEIPMSGRCGG